MSHNFLLNTNFHVLFNAIDQELVEQSKQQGCPSCKNKLHQANYPRSPSGIPAAFRGHYEARFSLCCHTCRKRTTPPSVRFFGRRWRPAPLFMFICILQCGINERRLRLLKRHFGITMSSSTWKRWRRWWREAFEETTFWRKERGSLVTPLKTKVLIPRALWYLFKSKQTFTERIRYLLTFLSPLTGGVLRAV